MEMTTKDFLNSFHEITGITIGERRKNLFTLLNRTKQLNFSNIDFKSIKPKSILEESFKLQTLLYFNKVPDLIDVLKSENPKLIHQVLNENFLKYLFEYMNETQLVEDYFPQFSFNTKLKLINKLSRYIKDEKQADVLFGAIEKKYGFYLATKLLPCCSADLILRCIQSLKFELTSRQFLHIVKKHPHLTNRIMKALSQYTESKVLSQKYKLVFEHVLKSDIQLFLKMQKEYQCCLRVGWRSTHKIIADSKDIVAREAVTFYEHLHAKQIVKSFTSDFAKFYINMFPSSLSCFKKDITYYVDLLKHLPPNVSKLNVLLSAFQETYGSDFLNYGCVHKSILELMSVDERESWMNSHSKPDYVSDEIWICLMKTEKSIPVLKEQISLKSDIKERAELIGCLIETCRINNDNEALLNVLKYVLTKHRNDNSTVLLSFFNTLQLCYNLNNLSDALWKCIIDLINHFMLRDEVTYQQDEWILAYINYLILKGQLTQEKFVLLMKKVKTMGVLHWYMKENHVKKTFLVTFGEVLYHNEDLKNRSVQFLQDVLHWNHKHPKNQVSLLPYNSIIEDFIEKNKNDYIFRFLPMHVLQLLHSDIIDQNKEKFLERFLYTDSIYNDIDLFLWLIKHKPYVVDKYLDRIVKILLKYKPTVGCNRFWLFCCNYSYLNFPQRISDLCLNLLKSKDCEDGLDKKNVLIALSCLMQPNQFIKLIETYYPHDLRMDVNSDDQDLYKIQQGIMISLKNVIPSSFTFDSILRFSKGDYMKLIQRTLHSVSHSAPENHLKTLFSSFTDHPVSVRKHAIYQTFKVLDKTAIFSMLNHFKQTERNTSVLKIIFKGTFNYFIKNPNDYTFDLVKKKLQSIDDCDEEAFAILLNIKKISFKYLPEYLVFSYGVFEKLPEGNAKVQEGKIQLLNSLTPEIMIKMSEEFSWGIVANLFKECTGFGDAVQMFSCRFLAYSVEDRVCDIFDIIKNVVSSWNNEKIKHVARKQVNTFVDNVCLLFIKDKNAPKQRFKSFVSLWNDFLKVHEAFHEYLKMYFTLCFLEGVDLSASIFQLCDRLNDFDCVVVVDVAQILNTFLSYFLEGAGDVFELNRLDLIKALVNSKKKLCILLAIYLLPYSFPDSYIVTKSYENVMQSLRNFKDPVICLYLSSYSHNLSLKKNIAENNVNVTQWYKSGFYVVQFTNKYRL